MADEIALEVGQVWRRKRTGALVRIVGLKNESRNAATPYYDVSWETHDTARVRRGTCWEDYWRRDNDPVNRPEQREDQ